MNKLLRTLWLTFRSRRRSPLEITDVGRLVMRVRPSDLDMLWHMNNGVYLSLSDLGRFDLLIRTGMWDLLKQRGWYPVVQSSTITYRRSLNPWERYTLESRVLGADDRSVYLEQRFVIQGQIAARLIIKGRFLGPEGSIPMAELIELFGMEPSSLTLPKWVERWSRDAVLPSTRDTAPSVWD